MLRKDYVKIMENEGKKTIANIFFLISILSPIGLTSILYLDFEQEIVVSKTNKNEYFFYYFFSFLVPLGQGTPTTEFFFKKTLILTFGPNVKYSALSCQITFFSVFWLGRSQKNCHIMKVNQEDGLPTFLARNKEQVCHCRFQSEFFYYTCSPNTTFE